MNENQNVSLLFLSFQENIFTLPTQCVMVQRDTTDFSYVCSKSVLVGFSIHSLAAGGCWRWSLQTDELIHSKGPAQNETGRG